MALTEVKTMSDQQSSAPKAKAGGVAAGAPSPATPRSPSDKYPSEFLQRLVDQAAAFNLMVAPDPPGSGAGIHGPNGVVGARARETLHRFDIDLQLPAQRAGVRAANNVGEAVGSVDLRWMIIPDDFPANPDREPPPTLLDASRSQRFAMQEMRFTFGQDGFRGFGTGRTFPMWSGGQAKLLAAAVGNITEGVGKFRGHEGNF